MAHSESLAEVMKRRTFQRWVFTQWVREMRTAWLEENDPKNGTDCVTPWDQFLYKGVAPR